MKKIILLLTGIFLFQITYAQTEREVKWNSDLDYLASELPEKHYNFFTVQSKEEFLSGINAIKQETKNLTNLQVVFKIQQLLAKAGDSHTASNFSNILDKKRILPLYLYHTRDGIYILHTIREHAKIAGCQLLSINKVPLTAVTDSLRTLVTIDNQASAKSMIPQLISSLDILEYFGFIDTDEVELELKTNTNEIYTYLLKPAEMNRENRISFKYDSISFCEKNKHLFFTDSYYPEEKIYYMLYNTCYSKELALQYGNKETAEQLPSFKEFAEKAFDILKNKPVDKIIFDMRYNGGGNSSQGTQFIEKLAEFLQANPDIKTYVVIGRQTFSSAILNSLDFKRLTNAVFVGEETSGKPNHFGEIKTLQLPESKLTIRYSTKYFHFTDENLKTITPDVTVEVSFPDLQKGVDPVYEWIKKQ